MARAAPVPRPVDAGGDPDREGRTIGRSRQALGSLRRWAGSLKEELYALYLAYRDPRVPAYARIFVAVVVAYAFSPIDLIPDLIPVLGYLDDLILVPLGIALAVRLIPPPVLAACREKARRARGEAGPRGQGAVNATVAVVAVWLLLAALAVYLVGGALGG